MKQQKEVLIHRVTNFSAFGGEFNILAKRMGLKVPPSSIWVAASRNTGEVIASAIEKTEIIRLVEERGYKVGMVSNDWN